MWKPKPIIIEPREICDVCKMPQNHHVEGRDHPYKARLETMAEAGYRVGYEKGFRDGQREERNWL